MPIALLPELTAAFALAGRVLAPWSRLVALEEQILRRARGAFLVHWFGTTVPVKGLNLHIAIANIEDLKRRYLEVREAMPRPAPELNLLGPLSGLAGLIVGMAASPTGAILMASQADRVIDLLAGNPRVSIFTLAYRVVGLILVELGGPAIGFIALPFLLVGGLAAALGGGAAQSVYVALGEVAMLIDAVVRFWDMLTGPRDQVRNPLLRKILNVLDGFAGLFVQFIGFAAFFVTRIARVLPYVMAQFRALVSLIEAVSAAGEEIFVGPSQLAAPFLSAPTPLNILKRVFENFVALPGIVVKKLTELVRDATASVKSAFSAIFALISTFAGDLMGRLADAFAETVVGVLLERIKTLLALLPAVRAAFATGPGRGNQAQAQEEQAGFFRRGAMWAATGGLTGALEDLFQSFRGFSIPSFPSLSTPSFPPAPTLPDLDAIMRRVGQPPTFDAARATQHRTEAAAALAGAQVPPGALRDPASAFAREQQELERTQPRPQLQLDDERLRDLIYIAVGRVLPPELRALAPKVRELFDWLDEHVYREPTERLEHPMLDIEDSGRLRPVVQVLTVRQRGGYAPDVRAFRDLLLEELQGRAYLAPQPA